jgi:hypothetical protein
MPVPYSYPADELLETSATLTVYAPAFMILWDGECSLKSYLIKRQINW